MNANYTNIVKAYSNLLTSGGNYGDQMRALAAGNKPQPELIEALAHTTAKHFKCHADISNRGAWAFYTDSESSDRHEGARTAWKRHVMPWIKPEATATVRKQVDKVEQTAARLQKQLTKRELTRLIKMLSA
jgi:hypothetical protein